MDRHVRHIGGGLLAIYEGDTFIREIGPTPGWDFKDRDEFIVRYNAALQSQQVASSDRGGWMEVWQEGKMRLVRHVPPPSPAKNAEAVQLLADLNGQIAVLLQRVAIAEAAAAPSGVSDADVKRACAEYLRWYRSTENWNMTKEAMRRIIEAAQPASSGVSDAARADAYDSWQSIATDMQNIDRLPQANHPPLSYWKSRVSALAALEAAQPQPSRVEGSAT
jgi:hypothetical protein